MSSLNFKGKSAVWNHHLSVPFHTLDQDAKKSLKGENSDENLIIHGDNLLALKALLPKYQGRIKCIYIDPPYNTGNENWVYNDNVNSPLIKDWLGKAVGKDDLTKHDKWLCMITPRLKLLRDLLADDGVIFVSIDDNEQAHLRNLMDEIFGPDCFVSSLVWTTKNAARGVPPTTMLMDNHEYVLCYARTNNLVRFSGVPRDENDFANPDNDPRGLWRSESIKATGGQNNRFEIINPTNGKAYRDNWAFSQEKIKQMIAKNLILFPTNGDGIPRQKKFIDSYINENKAIVSYLGWFSTENSTKQLMDIFEGKKIFGFPKPIDLIKLLIGQTTSADDLVLDSFSGSGTTAHAVLNLNKENDSKRKFILVEMEDYANKITAERVRRVIKKDKLKTGFTFYNLGPAIDAETILVGQLPTYEQFAKYVFYLATGKNLKDEKKIKEKEFLVGKDGNETIYLLYRKDMEALKTLAVTLDWAQAVHSKDSGKKIVYAPACYLDEESLDKFNIQFVSIPYNLFERTQ